MISLHNINELLRYIKQAALDAVKAQKPCDVMYAKVENVEPVSIKLENSLPVPEEMLIITRNIKTEIAVNDSVAVIRKQGGQKYLIVGVVP